ncbi:hypothetical protein RhiXN_08445 [Rhizoctonia solani]|uniref:Uncharacterized protein n=1 Tax=Rhizoctonia solani TaxID=456999 RepID=A0A8H8SZG6_9AGAM|nr:uncharacterized protein RhiXN_08445 [Rhizoctonia solani]QRW23409.1 hypothetical protein RhiXN_08445 [Rhizoctonia solani]
MYSQYRYPLRIIGILVLTYLNRRAESNERAAPKVDIKRPIISSALAPSEHFAAPQASSQNSDLARACSEQREDRFMPCRLASGLLRRLASYTPSTAARLCVSFLSHSPSRRSRELVWAAQPRARLAVERPRSTLAASQPHGLPSLTSLHIVADAGERAEDKF